MLMFVSKRKEKGKKSPKNLSLNKKREEKAKGRRKGIAQERKIFLLILKN